MQQAARQPTRKLFFVRMWNITKKGFSNPPFILSVFLLIALLYLVIGPLFTMIQSAFTLHPRDALFVAGEAGEFTTHYFVRTFFSRMRTVLFFEPFLNTLLVIFPMSALALLIGGVLAWLVVRTDLPGRRMIAKLAIIPYTLPSWTLALAWITLFKNRRIGGAAGILEWMGFKLPDWLSFGPIPIIVVMALHYRCV